MPTVPMRRRALGLAALLAAAVVACPLRAAAPDEALAEGDAHYARRAEGARGAVAATGEVDAAIAAYRRALGAAPDSAAARWRLVRALFFRGAFCGAAREEKKRLFEEARRIGEDGLARLPRATDGRERAERLATLRALTGALELHFWTAVSWGEWALARGKWAAAREGAAGRIRDLAQTVIEADPALEEGGGWRILGRLHAQSPKIIFITGWVSRDKALDALRRSLALGPRNAVTKVFLAEAILDHDRAHRDEARRLLEDAARTPPRPEYAVEDAHYAELARRLLTQFFNREARVSTSPGATALFVSPGL
jgi:tetratricopeptide (TPR) repeat protein